MMGKKKASERKNTGAFKIYREIDKTERQNNEASHHFCTGEAGTLSAKS